jgi:hypothetical protein
MTFTKYLPCVKIFTKKKQYIKSNKKLAQIVFYTTSIVYKCNSCDNLNFFKTTNITKPIQSFIIRYYKYYLQYHLLFFGILSYKTQKNSCGQKKHLNAFNKIYM